MSEPLVGLAPPPPGVTPDFHGISSVQKKFLTVYSITLFLAAVSLGMRLYTRIWINGHFGMDDYAASLSIFFSAAFFGICVACFDYGFGKHIWEVTLEDSVMYTKLLIGISVTYVWCPMLNKISILLLYHRMDAKEVFRYCVYIIMFIVVGYTLGATFTVSWACIPTNPENIDCVNALGMWQAILNIVTDGLMLLLPLPLLWSLQLPLLQKLGIALIFTMGSLVVITSSIRISYIMEQQDQPDFTFYQATTCIWSAVELNVGIMCNGLVVLKPFLRRFFPKLLRSSRKNSSNTPPGIFNKPNYRKKRPNSFQLTSLDRNEQGTEEGDGIVVTKSYAVENGNSQSTESIIPHSDSDRP